MAKKQSNQPTDMPEVIQIPINWNLEGAPVVFANQLLVNFDDHEVHLHFFEIVPPVIFGSDEQKQKQLEALTSVNARGVVRVVLSKERLPGIVEALNSIAAKIAAHPPEHANGKDRKSK